MLVVIVSLSCVGISEIDGREIIRHARHRRASRPVTVVLFSVVEVARNFLSANEFACGSQANGLRYPFTIRAVLLGSVYSVYRLLVSTVPGLSFEEKKARSAAPERDSLSATWSCVRAAGLAGRLLVASPLCRLLLPNHHLDVLHRSLRCDPPLLIARHPLSQY